ncbi:hypothetical protein ACFP5Z_09650 [Kocuria oceani]|jgi:hypothetical protein
MNGLKHWSRLSTATLLLLTPAACSIAGPFLLLHLDRGFLGWLWLFIGLAWLWIVFLFLAALNIQKQAQKSGSAAHN